MPNHKSAAKRSRQSLKRNSVNSPLINNLKNNINNFTSLISSKDSSEQSEKLLKSLSLVNSSLSKAVKKGLIKKKFASRKLSSLSKQINKL